MLWLSSITRADTLPAAWLIATGERPANLGERSALRRRVAREVLALQLGLATNAVVIEHDPAGRPFLTGSHATDIQISLATRGGIVAVALAAGPVGIDVESVDPDAEPPLALLHPDERAALLAQPASERALTFAQLWAAKESYVKALGTGFVRPPESFAVTLRGNSRFVMSDSGGPAAAQGWLYHGSAGWAAAVTLLG